MTATSPSTTERRVVVPPHDQVERPWRQTHRAGGRADRQFDTVVARLPPRIAELHVALPAETVNAISRSIQQMTALDVSHGAHLEPLAMLLTRTESVASSKIEQIEASVRDYARALHGVKANASAVSMVAATAALEALVTSVSGGQDIGLDAVLRAHDALIKQDPQEAEFAGRVRTMQNWIGGSDHSPFGAIYVPPPPDTVADYLTDLLRFANRDDLSALAQAAIVHAQFESVHPFTDGNGRIGRALINTVLRRRGVTHRVVIPVASALVAKRDAYFDHLERYRDGDAGPLIGALVEACEIAAAEAHESASRILALPERWMTAAGAPRAGSATRALLDTLMTQPIFSADEAQSRSGTSSSGVGRAIGRLAEAEVIRPLTNRTREQIWGAAALLDELDDLNTRIGVAARRPR